MSRLESWRSNLVEGDAAVMALLEGVRRIAVLGVKAEDRATQPAYYVPAYLAGVGLEVVPVPVYYPDLNQIMGRPVFRKVSEVPGGVDLVDVFRRPDDIPAHLPDILGAHPKVVWFQSGIRNDPAAEALARAGIRVVQDRCLMVDYQRFLAGGGQVPTA
ncbi:CoA-binding protein [Myxococcota bacterium]|nr:CoA-binding protein [Myxococcota bacterium]